MLWIWYASLFFFLFFFLPSPWYFLSFLGHWFGVCHYVWKILVFISPSFFCPLSPSEIPIICGFTLSHSSLKLCSSFVDISEGASSSVVSDSATPWTVVHQAHLSMEFSRKEYWSGLPCHSRGSPGDRPHPGIEPRSPTLQADSLPFGWLGFTTFFSSYGNIYCPILSFRQALWTWVLGMIIHFQDYF